MNFEAKDIPKKLMPLLQKATKYLVPIFLIFFVSIYAFLIFRVSTMARSEPDEDAIAEKLNTVKRPKIDQNAIDKIENLEDTNIQVQTLFNEARQNPFAE
jgi:hypothetical protein